MVKSGRLHHGLSIRKQTKSAENIPGALHSVTLKKYCFEGRREAKFLENNILSDKIHQKFPYQTINFLQAKLSVKK